MVNVERRRWIGASKKRKEEQELRRCVASTVVGWLAMWLDAVNLGYKNIALFACLAIWPQMMSNIKVDTL